MSGIAGALAIAISSITNERREGPLGLRKVIVFTDCQTAIGQLPKPREYTKEQLQGYALARKLVTRSQYLHRLVISLEIHWVPGHCKDIRGNMRADAGARRTAKSNINVSEREVIQFTL